MGNNILLATAGDKFDLLKDELKTRLTPSDKALERIAKYARWAKWYNTSGVWMWATVAAVGLGALGLQAVGVPIPVVIGFSTVTFGAAMAAKSYAMHFVSGYVEKKAREESNKRMIAKGIEPPPAPASPLPSITKTFNPQAILRRMQTLLPPKPANTPKVKFAP